MFIYYSSTNYSAETGGARLVGIRCDKCGCEYCYQLERKGTGGAGTRMALTRKEPKRRGVDDQQRSQS